MRVGRGLGIALLLLLVLAIGVFYVVTSLDSIVAAAIEKYGSRATGTRVEVSSVDLQLRTGQGSIREINVGNPAGFSAPYIFSLDDITTRLDINRIAEDPVVIEAITVASPHVAYEIDEAGRSNVAVLRENLAGPGATGEEPEQSGDGGPRIVIRKLVIEGGQIDAKVAALPDKQLSAKLPRIEINDIGQGQGGATARQVAEQITSVLLARVGTAVADLTLDQYLDQARDKLDAGLREGASEALGGAAEHGKDRLKGLLGQ